jgi:hypothetical protein
MGASQSSQPPSRHNSRHGSESKQKQKQTNVPIPPVPSRPPVPIITDYPGTKNAPEPLSSPTPAVALPIPVKKPSPISPPGDESIEQNKHLLRLTETADVAQTDGDMDETEFQSKFGITWVASDEFVDYEKKPGGMGL